MGSRKRDIQCWRQCTPQEIAYMTGYENTYGVYVYQNGCYYQGNGFGFGYGNGWNGYGNGWNGHGIGHMYGHGQTDKKLAELNLQLKKERDEKSKKEREFYALLENYGVQNKELLAENSKLTEQFAEMKRNESADLEEKTVLKQEIIKLKAAFANLKDDLNKARADANTLKVLNEKLLKGNDERDKIISHYRKQLANSTLKSQSSDSDSMLDMNSPVPINCREAMQRRRIGPRALHALTSLGAENTLGPWFCIPCGTIDSPLQFLTYAEYRRHLTEVDRKTIDPSLCKLCGWRCKTPEKMEAHLCIYKPLN